MILGKGGNIIKGTQSYEYIVSIIFKDKMQVPTSLLLFLITQDSQLSKSPHFSFKNISVLVPLEAVYT